MKLILPNDQEVILDEKLAVEEKQKIANEITDEWGDHFRQYWKNANVKVCLDVLSNYLTQAKTEEQKNKEDKYILSQKKMQRMKRGDKKVSHFSDLPADQKSMIGLIEEADDLNQ